MVREVCASLGARKKTQEWSGTQQAADSPCTPLPSRRTAGARPHPRCQATCHGRGARDGNLGLAGLQVERYVAHDGVHGVYQAQHHSTVLQTA